MSDYPDFLMIRERNAKRGQIEIYPSFKVKRSNDLMIRGGDFYAIWDESKGMWSTDEEDLKQIVDDKLYQYFQEKYGQMSDFVSTLYLMDGDSKMIDKFHYFCSHQMREDYHPLDEKIIFSDTEVKKEDYVSKRLSYPLQSKAGDCTNYNHLMSVLYSPEERHKIEWAIGSVVNGDSKKIQKFLVLYGAAGTGKSTVLNIIQQLFGPYCSTFDARALGSASNQFALEPFKTNPLVAIQHDGDLSHIEDNTRLNSLVSHEVMMVNEKFKSTYAMRFNCFLFIGTNRPVKITDAKSGLLRRLIDVSPSGNRLTSDDYIKTMDAIKFELGAIAQHCRSVYEEDTHYYDDYVPVGMLGASNDFYNFIVDSYDVFKEQNGVTAKQAWSMYKEYCEDAKVPYPMTLRTFRVELGNYFKGYEDYYTSPEGEKRRSYYYGFNMKALGYSDVGEKVKKKKEENQNIISIELFSDISSVFDTEYASMPAQYATSEGTPRYKWESVHTTLNRIDTHKLHYVKVPENHIVIDFDLKGPDGEKDLERNLIEASKWPATYTELSKSGKGVHLHYIYDGDVKNLSRLYEDNIEIKVFTGNSSLRRKLTQCNKLPIATISSGLPLKMKGGKKMVSFETVKSERSLRTSLRKGINREVWPNTKPSIDFIFKVLEDAHASDLKYDVTDMRNAILALAASSTHNAEYCIKLVNKMHFKSKEEPINNEQTEDERLVFYDVEVFPNLFIVNWKFEGESTNVVRMINPSPQDIEELMKFRLVGYNCRRYDNHIIYARYMGYTNEQLFNLSQQIITKGTGFFGEAYNISYTDVYDFCSKKQSLKKWEIELDIPHKELGIPWDQPVPEELWTKVAEYCDNDVLATEAVFNSRQEDFIARKILSKLASTEVPSTVNDTTNTLTARFIFGKNKHPQDQFNYRNIGEKTNEANWCYQDFIDGKPCIGKPYFPGYKYENGVSTYRGEEVGEGGYVFAIPGMYALVDDEDVSSMHPHSILAEDLFGDKYTPRFREIVNARIYIKQKKFDEAKTILNGALAEFLTDESQAKALSGALKIAINSVYGLTSAKFDNPFRDIRNIDNIVAKRGALFMIDLKNAVQQKGYKVVHVKTDSIKIAGADEYIIDFVREMGKAYGYSFSTEYVFDRFCLVNDAVFIAKSDGKWIATGKQFQVPYVFKTLFSHEPIEFKDKCETRSVTGESALYLDMNEGLEPDQHNYKFVGRIGSFCPIKPGFGGGELFRMKDGKYYAASGTKGWRWLESETVKLLGKEDCIDTDYYRVLIDDAVETISKYGDFEVFASEEPFPYTKGPLDLYSDPLPFY